VIFGYNTEIRLGDTIYHVQSEARESERLLQSQVFVKGHCISKRSTPSEQGASPQSAQESLRLQHRSVVERIRAGQLELTPAGSPKSSTVGDSAACQDFSLRCIRARRDGVDLVLIFQVSRAGSPVHDLKLRCLLIKPEGELAPELIAEPVTDYEGMAELRIGDTVPASAELQVELEGETRKLPRRFRLRQRENR